MLVYHSELSNQCPFLLVSTSKHEPKTFFFLWHFPMSSSSEKALLVHVA